MGESLQQACMESGIPALFLSRALSEVLSVLVKLV